MTKHHFGQFGKIVKNKTIVSLYPETKEESRYFVYLSDGTKIGFFENFKDAVKCLENRSGMKLGA